MGASDVRTQWESAAMGWARWEPTIATWMEPATEVMLDMAGIAAGDRVLDIACGAGSQTLRVASRVGPEGHVIATDIAETMLHHVQEHARAGGHANVTTLAGAAEDLELQPESVDAVICRLGLMLFDNPTSALRAVRRALRPGGKVSVLVFTTPAANPFLAKPMQLLLRHAGKTPPGPGRPGIFALGASGAIQAVLRDGGFEGVDTRTISVALRMSSATQALTMMQEAFGAYRAVVSDQPETVRAAAWAEVAETLKTFDSPSGFHAPAEVLVAAGARPRGDGI